MLIYTGHSYAMLCKFQHNAAGYFPTTDRLVPQGFGTMSVIKVSKAPDANGNDDYYVVGKYFGPTREYVKPGFVMSVRDVTPAPVIQQPAPRIGDDPAPLPTITNIPVKQGHRYAVGVKVNGTIASMAPASMVLDAVKPYTAQMGFGEPEAYRKENAPMQHAGDYTHVLIADYKGPDTTLSTAQLPAVASIVWVEDLTQPSASPLPGDAKASGNLAIVVGLGAAALLAFALLRK